MKTQKIALITGITGQDGSYLAELLLEKGYIVHGIKRRSSSFNTGRIDHIYKDKYDKNAKLFLHYGDLSDSTNIIRIIKEVQPDEIYNLGAMSHVHVSFETPEYAANVDGLGALRVLEAVRLLGMEQKTKIYQASTSELYGKVVEIPQNEKTPFCPQSPYAAAKLYAYWITKNYREAYGMYVCNGILFNHESPRRGETFVTKKITRAAVALCKGKQDKLYLGNLDSVRDWGHAKDFVRAMYLMMQQEKSDDYVIATGHKCTVREFVFHTFEKLGIEIEFMGAGVEEKGRIKKIYTDKFLSFFDHVPDCFEEGYPIIEVKQDYFRPTDVDFLLGDSTKAKTVLGWEPSYTLKDMISEMIESDLRHV